MGKVRSFFSVLGCPKSNRTRGGPRNSKRSSKSLSADDSVELNFSNGNNFSFSNQVGPFVFPVESEETPPDDCKTDILLRECLFNQKEAAVVALCNTLNLKLRHSLVVAFVCLQRRALRLHLCRFFIKKIVFVITRKLEIRAREAVVALRSHRELTVMDDRLRSAITAVELLVDKVIKCNQRTTLRCLRENKIVETENTPVVSREIGTVDDTTVNRGNSSIRSASSQHRLATESVGEWRSAICQQRSYTADPLKLLSPQDKKGKGERVQILKSVKALVDPNSSWVPDSNLGFNSKTESRSIEYDADDTGKIFSNSGAGCSNKKCETDITTTDRDLLSNNIFQRAIKRINVMTPLKVSPKSNIVGDLEFFTSLPYVNYVNKALDFQLY